MSIKQATRGTSASVETDAGARPDSSSAAEPTIVVRELEPGFDGATSGAYWEWQRLFAADSAARITQHPDYVLRELAADVRTSSEQGQLLPGRLIGVGDNRGWTALAVLVPKVIRLNACSRLGPRWTLSGWRLAGNRFLGVESEQTQQRLLQAVTAELCQSGAHMLLIEDLEQDSILWQVIRRQQSSGFGHWSFPARAVVPSPFQERLRIRFPSHPDDYWARFSSKTRNTFRRKLKKLEDAQVVRITQPCQIAEFLDHSHRISLNSWQTHQFGLRVRNSDSELELLTFLALQEALRSYLLVQGDRPIAFLIGTQFNGYFNYEEVAYDREFSDRSPGQVLLLKVLEDLLSHDTPKWFDFGGGDADYKRLFATDCSKSGNIWLMPSTFRNVTTMAFVKVRHVAGAAARRTLRATGLISRVRQWMRR